MKKGKQSINRLQSYLITPFLCSAVIIVTNVAMLALDRRAALLMLPASCICLILSVVLYLYRKPLLLKDLVNFSMEHAQVQNQLLRALPMPYAIIDEAGKILWINYAFQREIGKEKNKNIRTLFPEVKRKDIPVDDEHRIINVRHGDRYLRLELVNVVLPGEFTDSGFAGMGEEGGLPRLLALYIFDETESIGLRKTMEEEQMVAGLIYLDNYEEAMALVDEVRVTVISALVDRKITRYFAQMGAVIKKLEKDRYFVAVKQKYLPVMTEDHFRILEDVRTMNTGTEIAFTLSIGLGCGAATYEGNYEYARTAIDMALGRGGDQAVIKDGENISYHGGKSQATEKNTRVKARVKAHALKELLLSKEEVLIMGHKLGDVDSLGAAIGLYRAATTLDRKARIVINDITAPLRPVIEKFKNDSEYPEDLFLNSSQAMEAVTRNTVVIVADVNRPGVTECPELLDMSDYIVILDHHRQTRDSITNAVLSYVEPYASSTCELVAEILQYIGDDIKIRGTEADVMYGGIILDTDSFLSRTGVRTFEAAAFLRRSGADMTRVRKIFRDKMEDHKAQAEAVRSAEIFENVFAITTCPAEGVESPTIVGAKAANELLNVVGVDASIVLTDYQNKIYVSARSGGEINVQLVMEKLGGGGHSTMAGAQLTGCTVQEALQYVKVTIKQMLDEGEI